MFVKIVIILLLLIVAASLLGGRAGADRGTPAARRRGSAHVRPLMARVAIVLLVVAAVAVVVHLSGCSKPG